MKFLLDHDVPDDLSYLLEELNHEVTLLRKEQTNGLRYFGCWNVLAKLVF